MKRCRSEHPTSAVSEEQAKPGKGDKGDEGDKDPDAPPDAPPDACRQASESFRALFLALRTVITEGARLVDKRQDAQEQKLNREVLGVEAKENAQSIAVEYIDKNAAGKKQVAAVAAALQEAIVKHNGRSEERENANQKLVGEDCELLITTIVSASMGATCHRVLINVAESIDHRREERGYDLNDRSTHSTAVREFEFTGDYAEAWTYAYLARSCAQMLLRQHDATHLLDPSPAVPPRDVEGAATSSWKFQ